MTDTPSTDNASAAPSARAADEEWAKLAASLAPETTARGPATQRAAPPPRGVALDQPLAVSLDRAPLVLRHGFVFSMNSERPFASVASSVSISRVRIVPSCAVSASDRSENR